MFRLASCSSSTKRESRNELTSPPELPSQPWPARHTDGKGFFSAPQFGDESAQHLLVDRILETLEKRDVLGRLLRKLGGSLGGYPYCASMIRLLVLRALGSLLRRPCERRIDLGDPTLNPPGGHGTASLAVVFVGLPEPLATGGFGQRQEEAIEQNGTTLFLKEQVADLPEPSEIVGVCGGEKIPDEPANPHGVDVGYDFPHPLVGHDQPPHRMPRGLFGIARVVLDRAGLLRERGSLRSQNRGQPLRSLRRRADGLKRGRCQGDAGRLPDGGGVV